LAAPFDCASLRRQRDNSYSATIARLIVHGVRVDCPSFLRGLITDRALAGLFPL